MYADPIIEDFTKVGWHLLDISHVDYCKPFLYYHHFNTRIREKVNIFYPFKDEIIDIETDLKSQFLVGDDIVQIAYTDVLAELRRYID